MAERFDISQECNQHDQVTPQSFGAPDNEIDVVECPRFYEFIAFELATKQDITCEEIKDIETVEGYCKKILAEEDLIVWNDADGQVVDLCAERPEQPLPPNLGNPPVDPGPVDCSGDDWPNTPIAEVCCNGAIQPVAPVCEKACNSISPGDVENYPYCCDGTVPGSGVSTGGDPLPAICATLPSIDLPVLMSTKK